MFEIVEGQFSDAESENDVVNEDRKSSPKEIKKHVTFSLEDEVKELIIYSSSEEIEEDCYSDEDMYIGESKGYGKYNGMVRTISNNMNAQQSSKKVSSFQPSDKLLKKYSDKINLEMYEGPSLPNHATNYLMETNRKFEAGRCKEKDKKDRATVEQVMDPRTRMILFKLLDRGTFSEVNGCISTGKEANVYHATTNQIDKDYAIKVYKTIVRVFKDRQKYVNGEFRFRHRHSCHNSRKMVLLWAEKEMRNLIRLKSAGLRVPDPILLKSNVLVMSFLGTNGWPSPKLKDAVLNSSKACRLYRDCIRMMWVMYNKCKLVHADLSEYNLLYHEGEAYIIDVSQSVEHDHPHSLDFLRKDCNNITEFFKRKGVAILTVKELFDFITDANLNEDKVESFLDEASTRLAGKEPTHADGEAAVEEEVFKGQYIPQRLTEVVDFERDISLVKTGLLDVKELPYTKIVGLPDVIGNTKQEDKNYESSDDGSVSGSEDEKNNDSGEESEDGESKSKFINSARPRDESPESKKARKKEMKDQKAEKRKTKVKKHVKKRKEKLMKANSKKLK
ncbi:unnamed protein product [Nezara viridula]|uniref:Serine/threonine-protein kinase RIO1 n=1 Tax=Nezara viridula TaxID=85310 RepID=A0A9P0H9R3_NEZVI|nr:unnamed protein product [Nezara viridula]